MSWLERVAVALLLLFDAGILTASVVLYGLFVYSSKTLPDGTAVLVGMMNGVAMAASSSRLVFTIRDLLGRRPERTR